MDKTIEIGKAGLANTEDRFQAVNLAIVNAETPGFRRFDVLSRSFPLELAMAEDRLASQGVMKPVTEGIIVNQAQGTSQPTGKKTDVAIEGTGFFVVQAPWGSGYTRDGRFRLDADGRLVYGKDGWPVLGEGGPIIIPPGKQLDISGNGVIRVDEQEVDRLQIVTFQNPEALESVNGVVLRSAEGRDLIVSPAEGTRLAQGFVEQSNAETIPSMMQLLFLARLYQYDTRVLQVRDQLLGRAMDLARPAQ